ncbi:unnamed protein product [Chilo suppressalis]|uniref:Uncharacterized protein n=1 Tax=Chilo suppressalis TaxID=168631 RepID=A0ABN8LCH6_CHISP|nr:unnamed protein product [Chilo suppressalis]
MEKEPEIPVYGEVCKRKLKRKRQRMLLTELFFDFSKNTTLHGLRYVTDSGLEIIEKIFWTLTFFVSVALSFYFIFNVWHKWKTSPVIVSFSEKHISVEAVPFPSVTICPQMKSMSHKKHNNQSESNDDDNQQYPNSTYYDEDVREALSLMCDSVISPFAKIFSHIDASVVNQLYNLSLDYENMFAGCNQYMTKPRGCTYSFKKSLTEDGVCYTYNGLSDEEILRGENIQQEFKYTQANQATRNWTMADGYITDDPKAYPVRGLNSAEDRNMGFKLNIRHDIKNEICQKVYSTYKIYLHHPADLPQSSSYYFAALPDQLSSMALQFTMVTTSKTLKSYPLETRQCYFPEDKWLKYFQLYTYNNCKLECLRNITYKLCGCVAYYMPHSDSNEICAARAAACIHFGKTLVLRKWKECNCLPACNSVQYNADIHKDYYDAAKGRRLRNKQKNKGIINYPLAKVNIFYKEPMFMSIRRSELFGLTDFLGQCGGLLGLFLGFSFLSLIEIFYFVTFRVYYTFKMDLKREKEQNISYGTKQHDK